MELTQQQYQFIETVWVMRVTFSIGLMGIKPTLTVVTIVKICDKEIYGIYIYNNNIYR